MSRLALYIIGVSSVLTAWAIYKRRADARRPIPAKQAAAMLQEAWADYHTRA